MILDFITWDVDPVIIHFGDGGIRWYGLFWAIGLYVCWKVNELMYKKENCPAEWPDLLFFWMAAGVIIGARLGHCWFYEWHQYGKPWYLFGWEFTYRNPYIENPLRLIKIWEGGLSSHGGAIGLIIAAILLNKFKYSKYPQFGTSWIWILDRLCIGVCFTAMLIRLGNLPDEQRDLRRSYGPALGIYLRERRQLSRCAVSPYADLRDSLLLCSTVRDRSALSLHRCTPPRRTAARSVLGDCVRDSFLLGVHQE